MTETTDARSGSVLGVCLLPAPAPNAPRTVQDAAYLHEVLGHAGLCYDAVSLETLPARLDHLRLLVTVGEYPLPDGLKARLEDWVNEGGAWLSIGGLCGMEDLLGARFQPPAFVLWAGTLRALGEGYLDARGSTHPILADLPLPLHFFSGAAVTAQGATVLATTLDAHHRPTDQPALLERTAGAGRCLVLTPDVTGSIVRIQQGTAVTRDGIPAPDGTGPVSDGVLKSDDGQALDWLLDREPVPDAPSLFGFLQPVADQWRGVVLRAIFHLATEQGVALPLLWHYPDNRVALGHISHDTDGNDPAKAMRLLETLEAAGIRSTWCVILPGYAPEIIGAIRDAGHELATHFDAVTEGCPWGETHFDRQRQRLREMFGQEPTTNKNHYLRWEGDTEFFAWCIARGIQMDQSKGTSKTGEAGFNFGTCHPYRPVAPDGSVLPILEMTTPTQDLLVFAPEAIVAPLLEGVVRQYGILHLLFHPAHIDKPGVADALTRAVRAGQQRGLAWWTARAITEWEEARRKAAWSSEGENGVALTAAAPLPGATLLYLARPAARLRVNGEAVASETVERWGFRFHAVVRDLDAGETIRLEAVR